jgi:hypothetical protein
VRRSEYAECRSSLFVKSLWLLDVNRALNYLLHNLRAQFMPQLCRVAALMRWPFW